MARKKLIYEDYINTEKLGSVTAMKRNGATDENVAAFLGVGVKKLRSWKNEYPELRKAFAFGREEMLHKLENEAFKRALGYSVTNDEITTEYDGAKKGPDGKPLIIKRTVKRKKTHIWSDTLLLRYLAIADPEKWGNKEAPKGEAAGAVLQALKNSLKTKGGK